MSRISYPINRAINKPIEFHGLKGQYILYVVAGLIGSLFLFATLYLLGCSPYPCLALILLAAISMVRWIYSLSKRLGQYGMMKKWAARRIPTVLISRSRSVFGYEESKT